MPAPTTMTFLGVPAARGSSGSGGIPPQAVPAVKARFRSVLRLSIFETHVVHLSEVLLETQCNGNGGRRGSSVYSRNACRPFSPICPGGTEPDYCAIRTEQLMEALRIHYGPI